MRHLGTLLALFTLGWTPAAAALPAVHVDVTADSGCAADSAGVFARLQAQDPSLRLAGPEEAAPLRMHFAFEAAADAVHGRVTLQAGEAAPGDTREVQGESCEEVIDALVLIALVLAEETDSVRSEGSSAVPPTPTAPPPSPRRAVPLEAPIPSVERAPLARRPAARPAVGVGIGSIRGLVPQWGLSALLFADLELGRERVLASLRLTGSWVEGRSVEREVGSADFRALLGRLDACAPRLEVAFLSLDGCASVGLGRVQGSSGPADRRTEIGGQWAAVGLLVRASAPLHRTLRLSLELAGLAPLRDASYYFSRADGSREIVFQFPTFGASAAIGLAMPIL